MIKVDLTDLDQIEAFIKDVQPDILVHSAAQRFPDKMQKNPEEARKLNVEATKVLASSISKWAVGTRNHVVICF